MRIPCPTVTQRYSKRKQIPFSVYLSSFALGRERVQPITNQVRLPLIQHLVQLSLRVRHQTDTWDKSKWFEVTFHLLILPPDVPLWCRRRSRRPLAPSEADKVRFYWIKISLSLTRSCSLSSDLYTPRRSPHPSPHPRQKGCMWICGVSDRCMWLTGWWGRGSAQWRKMFDRLRAGLCMTQGLWRCLNLKFQEKQSHTFKTRSTRSLPQCSIPREPTASEVVVPHQGGTWWQQWNHKGAILKCLTYIDKVRNWNW